MNGKKFMKRLTAAVTAISILVVLYIMLNGLGLQPDLDFGAGAYYYADIPDFDKYTEGTRSLQGKIPYVVYAGLFLAWGALMYVLWKWVDRK